MSLNTDSGSWSCEVTSTDPLIKTIWLTYAFDTALKKNLCDVHLRRRTQHPTTNEHFQFTALSRTRVYLSAQGYKILGNKWTKDSAPCST